jgi:hypothetical protein
MSETTAALTLPSGVWHGEDYYRRAIVRSLCGEDELFWLDLPDRWSLPQRVSALLERVVGWEAAPPPDGIVGGLTVGDRETLLLHLHRLSFGSRIECVLNCPQCGEKLDVDLHTDDLLLPPYDQPQPEYDAPFGDGYLVRFRLPTGADQAHIAGLAQADLDAAEQALIDRCVLAVSHHDQPLERLPQSLNADLADCMAQLDAQAELSIRMTCPICGTDFATLLDMAQFLAAEIANHSRLLNREIHTLALYYHWSEAEILHLPAQRRQTYLHLLDESFGGEELA